MVFHKLDDSFLYERNWEEEANTIIKLGMNRKKNINPMLWALDTSKYTKKEVAGYNFERLTLKLFL